ncbi:hypothetical protein [Streptomyces sp. NPDC056796]|uniref:hypothetical protein n=1 Tax=Streptomyces sp. NPDC056796 TaxID=3345947 RepID=UPI003690817B
MKIPSNVARCVECDGPIKSVQREPYACNDCGRDYRHADGLIDHGTVLEIVGGWLLIVKDDGIERDSEEEIADLYGAFDLLAKVFGDGLAASHIGPSLTCGEANAIAEALVVGNQKDAAITFLEAHGKGDDIDEDEHGGDDFDGFEHLGLAVKAEPERLPLEVVTVDGLVELLGL